jgi:hypothetical protein
MNTLLVDNRGKRNASVACVVISGDLAITRSLDGDGWAITHVPTGLKLGPQVSLPRARRRLEQLLALKLDWSHKSRRRYLSGTYAVARAITGKP